MKTSYEHKIIVIYCIIFFVIVIFAKGYHENIWTLVKTIQLHQSHPDWIGLTQDQQEVLQPLQEDWVDLTPDKRIIFLVLAKRILKLDQRNITIFKERIQNWSMLSPEERRVSRDNYLSSLEISQNDKIKTWKAYQELSPDERQLLERQAFQKKSLVNSPSLPNQITH